MSYTKNNIQYSIINNQCSITKLDIRLFEQEKAAILSGFLPRQDAIISGAKYIKKWRRKEVSSSKNNNGYTIKGNIIALDYVQVVEEAYYEIVGIADVDFYTSINGSLSAGLLAEIELISLNIYSQTAMDFDINNIKSKFYNSDNSKYNKSTRGIGIGLMSFTQNTKTFKNHYYTSEITTYNLHLNFFFSQTNFNFDSNWNINNIQIGYGTSFSLAAFGGVNYENFFGIVIKI